MNQTVVHHEPSTGTNVRTLASLHVGERGCVRCTEATGEDVRRLQGLGLFPGVKVRVIRNADPMILRLFGTRIGLAREIAEHILMDPLPDTDPT